MAMVKPKIACYITGGWTECGYMTRFLEEINDSYTYMQRFPQKIKGKKGKDRKQFSVDGRTGTDLEKYIYADLRKYKEELKDYCGIIIEDDLDDRFFDQTKRERDFQKIAEHEKKIADEIKKIIQNEELQIFFLYALPEIESWFLADWDNTFGCEYRDALQNMNSYFSTTFRRYIEKAVFKGKQTIADLENFGYFESGYVKLSDALIDAFRGYTFENDIVYTVKNNTTFDKEISELIRKNEISYSKKKEGINMLKRLDPEKVAAVCTYYFSKKYSTLKHFDRMASEC